MNKLAPYALMFCFSLSIIYQWYGADWQTFDLYKLIIIAVLSGVLWVTTDYKQLPVKSVAFLVFLDAIWNIGQFFMDGAWQGPLELLNAIIFIPWLLFAYNRSYDIEEAMVQDGYIYNVSHRPDSFTGFIHSIFSKKATSGYSVLCNGELYSYRHGVFRKADYSVLKNGRRVITRTHIKATDGVVNYLGSMIGKRWHWWQNCVTMQIKLRTIRHV